MSRAGLHGAALLLAWGRVCSFRSISFWFSRSAAAALSAAWAKRSFLSVETGIVRAL